MFQVMALSFALIPLPSCLAVHSSNLSTGYSLQLPQGRGPFPAVVLLHGCSGILDGVERAWASRLRTFGYATLLVDSFTPRGYREICSDFRLDARTTRVVDSYDALRFLQAQRDIDPHRVGLIGFSNGGVATLAAMNPDHLARVLPMEQRLKAGFQAAIAFYPECGIQYGQWRVRRSWFGTGRVTGATGVYRTLAPLLIITGGLDDWTDAGPCQDLTFLAQKSSQHVEIVVHPHARHGFDNTQLQGNVRFLPEVMNINKPLGCCGATVGGNAEALTNAIAHVQRFFASHLGE